MKQMRSLSLGVLLASLWLPATSYAASCESLARLTLDNAKITIAQEVAAGAFMPPGIAARQGGAPPQQPRVYAGLPAFCRIAATLTPSSDSDIKVEVWLPSARWNGKFQAVGNGGWAGTIPYAAMAAAVAAGYATASTDTGHVGNSGAFALGHPEKVTDFAYRSVHEMTVKAKAVIDAFYSARPTLSIWNGCSQGGRQGITEAVRFPADFDAVIAGAPAVNWIHLHAGRMAINRSVNAAPAGVIPPSKYPALHRAAIAACDARDGVADNVIENPGACSFDPKALACSPSTSLGAGGDDATCLTPAQVESARKMYAGATNPSTRASVLPGLARGSELGWNVIGSAEPIMYAADAYKYVIVKDRNWDPVKFNPATDLDLALAADPDDVLGSTDPNLRTFFGRGGKLLLYHGWSDPQVTPYNTVDFFQKVVASQGGAGVGTSIQLYMVPGMNHCQGGPGTDNFDRVGAMEEWIKTGSAPKRIEAWHVTAGTTDRTRPLCPFGQVAKWSGSGSANETANFACVAATLEPVR